MYGARGVDGGQRGDGDARGEDRARGADAALEAAGHRARAGARVALGDRGAGPGVRRGRGRRPAQCGVRTGPPVAAAPQVEEGRGGHDGDDLGGIGADAETAAPLLQPGGDTGRGVKTEGTAAGQHDRLDARDEVARVERVGLPGAGAAAADVDGSDRAALGGEDDGGSGQVPVVGPPGMADPEAEDVGQGVPRPRGVRRMLSNRPVPSR